MSIINYVFLDVMLVYPDKNLRMHRKNLLSENGNMRTLGSLL